jgi:hypothetical protein
MNSIFLWKTTSGTSTKVTSEARTENIFGFQDGLIGTAGASNGYELRDGRMRQEKSWQSTRNAEASFT